MLGIFGTFLVFQTISIPDILAAAPAMAGSTIGFLCFRVDTMTVLCILLFIGAMGKSAQLGLHTWLPDAMEGPTPVCALIHAATMVTAGVFMVCRLSPMFEAAPVAPRRSSPSSARRPASSPRPIGTRQWDIKRVIAYSTCSQLGYMFFAAGVGAYRRGDVPPVHPRLLQGAAVPRRGQRDPRDAPRAGHAVLRRPAEADPDHLLGDDGGTLAITGVGIAGVFGFAGFYSKDAHHRGGLCHGHRDGQRAFWLGVFAALLTSFYSWRLMFLTFWGKPRWAESEHIQHAVHDDARPRRPIPRRRMPATTPRTTCRTPHHGSGTGGYHPHESPWTMLVPLLPAGGRRGVRRVRLLRAGSSSGASFWNGAIAFNERSTTRCEEFRRRG